MKLTKEQMESVKCTLIDETSDFILDRVCELMYEISAKEILSGPTCVWRDIKTWNNYAYAAPHDLDLDQIDEVVCAVFKGFYYEKTSYNGKIA